MMKNVEYTVSCIDNVYSVRSALIDKEASKLESVGVVRLNVNPEGSLSFYIEKKTAEENDAAKGAINKIIAGYVHPQRIKAKENSIQ